MLCQKEDHRNDDQGDHAETKIEPRDHVKHGKERQKCSQKRQRSIHHQPPDRWCIVLDAVGQIAAATPVMLSERKLAHVLEQLAAEFEHNFFAEILLQDPGSEPQHQPEQRNHHDKRDSKPERRAR